MLRLKRQSKKIVIEVLERLVVPRLSKEPIGGKLWIVDEVRVRVHG